MVRRLVEEQDVGLGRQHMGKRRTAGLAAGEVGGLLVAGQPELLQQVARPVRIVARSEARLHIGQGAGIAGKVGLLGQIAHGGPGLHEALAAVGLDETCGDFEQSRLARAVAADKAGPLAGGDGQLGALDQGRAAEGESDVLEEKQRGKRHSCSPDTS